MKDFFFVAIGAIAGSSIRFYTVESLGKLMNWKPFGTIIVNIVASFLLGLFLALKPSLMSEFSISYVPFLLVIGFLGSLSTFSSFIIETLDSILENNVFQGALITSTSIFGGILAIISGYIIGNG